MKRCELPKLSDLMVRRRFWSSISGVITIRNTRVQSFQTKFLHLNQANASRIGRNPDFCSTIDMEWNHNHSVQSLHSLSFKDVPASVISHIKEMFAGGLLPGAAYRELLRQLRSECKDDLEYHRRLSDRSQAPRRKDFNDIYTDFKKERFGTGSMSEMFSTLEERIKCLKQKDEEYIIEFQKFDESIDQPFILVVITPLMKRVHKLVSMAQCIPI